ncbi:hypothetical protein AB0M54_11675 [Actinoplanes sp. NPDC051470]|uniref:hypothetical protein n=1 Tax=Actinoplanes sp. NPDC051470 TaxID=3157224 RepID=UPI0034451EF2
MTADREVCGAERFMHSSGPSLVPLKACCAAAILHAVEDGHPSAPFICAASDRLTSRTVAAAHQPEVASDRLTSRTVVAAHRPEVGSDRLAGRTGALSDLLIGRAGDGVDRAVAVSAEHDDAADDGRSAPIVVGDRA